VPAILQQAGPRAGFERPQDLLVPGVCGQYSDSRFGKFPANRDHRINTIHFRHLQVHQGDVRTVATELVDRLPPILGLRD
jgi:hypothetical protein